MPGDIFNWAMFIQMRRCTLAFAGQMQLTFWRWWSLATLCVHNDCTCDLRHENMCQVLAGCCETPQSKRKEGETQDRHTTTTAATAARI
jgi:hypothetical protein